MTGFVIINSRPAFNKTRLTERYPQSYFYTKGMLVAEVNNQYIFIDDVMSDKAVDQKF